jgi:hypothetical protein
MTTTASAANASSSVVDVEKLLFQQVEKPKNYLMTRSFNVYDNRYRINVYHELVEDNLTKKRIHASYFARLNDDKLELITLKT